MAQPIVGSVWIGGEWVGVHVLQPTHGIWYEWRIDDETGTCSGVSQRKNVQVDEHPDGLNCVGCTPKKYNDE